MATSSIEQITAGLFAVGAARGYLLALKDVLEFLQTHGQFIEVAELAGHMGKLNSQCSDTSIAQRIANSV